MAKNINKKIKKSLEVIKKISSQYPPEKIAVACCAEVLRVAKQCVAAVTCFVNAQEQVTPGAAVRVSVVHSYAVAGGAES